MVTTVMMTQQNVAENPQMSNSTAVALLSNSPPNSPIIVSATKLREEEKRIQMVRNFLLAGFVNKQIFKDLLLKL